MRAVQDNNNFRPQKIVPGIVIPAAPAAATQSTKCICQGSASGSEVTCIGCNVVFHRQCINYVTSAADAFRCMMCRLYIMDPFWPTEKILCSLVLMANTNNKRERVINIPDLTQLRRENREVWVRSIALSDDNDIKQAWPLKFEVLCNNSPAITIKEPERHHKRRDETIRISSFLRSGENQLSFTWQLAPDSKYLVIVVICESRPPAYHFDYIKKNQRLLMADCKTRLMNLLGEGGEKSRRDDDDVECLDVSQRVKLTCPYTCMRIEVPGRGRHCRHLQCFDLEGFLSLTATSQSINRRWQCPCCQLRLWPEDIVVDELFLSILDDESNVDRDELNINPDGSFVPAHVRIKKRTEDDQDASSSVRGATGTSVAGEACGIVVEEKKESLNLVDSDEEEEDEEDENDEPLRKRGKFMSDEKQPISHTTSSGATMTTQVLNNERPFDNNSSAVSIPAPPPSSSSTGVFQQQIAKQVQRSFSNQPQTTTVTHQTNTSSNFMAPQSNQLITKFAIPLPPKSGAELNVIELSDSD
eukprot:GDKJ01030595.1.p1 GENE.GDKJ01030595.1~~GDKJ01030595.1.p1  ORF type:complete len:529 (+),score=95.53 GDKJ01030595.1:17-1603(+)